MQVLHIPNDEPSAQEAEPLSIIPDLGLQGAIFPSTGPDWARNKVQMNALSLVRVLVFRTLGLEEIRPEKAKPTRRVIESS